MENQPIPTLISVETLSHELPGRRHHLTMMETNNAVIEAALFDLRVLGQSFTGDERTQAYEAIKELEEDLKRFRDVETALKASLSGIVSTDQQI